MLSKLIQATRFLLRGEYTYRDIIVSIARKAWTKLQIKYNFYVKKYRYLDNLKNRNVAIVVLIGKYPSLWSIALRRVYEYADEVDVIVVNAGAFHSDEAVKLSREYNFSYFECIPNNFVSAQNFVIKNIVSSPLIVKMDDDVFITRYTIRNLVATYRKLKEEGYDIGFVAPVLNVNNVSYYYFLKTLNLVEKYEQLFEKPIYIRNWDKQRVWYDPQVAVWLWEHSLPLNEVADVFNSANQGKIEVIPVRFSIQCILFERSFVLESGGYLSPLPRPSHLIGETYALHRKRVLHIHLPFGDERSINFYANDLMYGRFLALDSFAGHLAYFPQSEVMLKWFEKNRKRLIEDLS